MNKQSIFQTLLLTVLAISAIALGWLCFDSKATANEEDYVPLCAMETTIVRTLPLMPRQYRPEPGPLGTTSMSK